MKRGELWTVAGGPGVAGKPRPALIVQDDAYRETTTVTICPVTTDETEAPGLREALLPDRNKGLGKPSHVMIDKIVTVPRARLGKRIGAASAKDMARIDLPLLVFLGLAQ